MGSWYRVCFDCRTRVNKEPGFAFDNVSSQWQDEVAMAQDKLVAANLLADKWKDRTMSKRSTQDPTNMTIPDFAELDKEEQLDIMEDGYAAVYWNWPKFVHRGVDFTAQDTPESEIPTLDQI